MKMATPLSGNKPGHAFSSNIVQEKPDLENLPAELRYQVLMWMPDLPTLHSFVHASPMIYAQYREHRATILRMCLDHELDGFYLDAYANLMSRVRVIGSPRTDSKITEFLSSYGAHLSGLIPHPDVNSPDSEGIRWMTAYHNAVARPLAQSYAKWALANFRDMPASAAAGSETTDLPRKINKHDIGLSKSEEIRIYRALYRYGTYYHLFGRNEGNRHGTFQRHEINEIFFGLFDPWEAEAVGCIDMFVRQKYDDIFNEIKRDLAPTNERYKQPNGVFNPSESFDLDAEHSDYMNGTVSRGLKMTARLLAIHDHEKLVAKMEECLTHDQCLDAPLRLVLGTLAQDDRRQLSTNFPSTRDITEQRRDLVDFAGDGIPPNTPPLAWVLLWNGRYANIYGDYVPELLRRCGYVIWDEQRWVDTQARDFIFKQWETAPELVEEIEMDCNWSPVEDHKQENDSLGESH
ncbi:hypothetical protein EsH8_VI_000163 [Colletotrichum jinshuiense]